MAYPQTLYMDRNLFSNPTQGFSLRGIVFSFFLLFLSPFRNLASKRLVTYFFKFKSLCFFFSLNFRYPSSFINPKVERFAHGKSSEPLLALQTQFRSFGVEVLGHVGQNCLPFSRLVAVFPKTDGLLFSKVVAFLKANAFFHSSCFAMRAITASHRSVYALPP